LPSSPETEKSWPNPGNFRNFEEERKVLCKAVSASRKKKRGANSAKGRENCDNSACLRPAGGESAFRPASQKKSGGRHCKGRISHLPKGRKKRGHPLLRFVQRSGKTTQGHQKNSSSDGRLREEGKKKERGADPPLLPNPRA